MEILRKLFLNRSYVGLQRKLNSAIPSWRTAATLPGMFEFDSPDRPLEDHEYPDDDDSDDDWEETDVAPCPRCGAEIAADSVRCPICGDYVTAETAVWQGKAWWWVLLGVLGIAAVIVALGLL